MKSTTASPFILSGTARCESCAFCAAPDGDDHNPGECRLLPPTVTASGKTEWPQVGPDTWCGHYWPDRETEIDLGIVTQMEDGKYAYGFQKPKAGD